MCFAYFTLVKIFYKEYDKKSITYESITSIRYLQNTRGERVLFSGNRGAERIKSVYIYMTYNLITYTSNIIYVLCSRDLSIPVI